MPETSSGWTTAYVDRPSAEFRNDQQGLSVKIEPRYRASASRKRSRAGEPISYRVKVVQDWFSKGVHGDRSMNARVDTWEEATTVAEEFMREFHDERTTQPETEIEATHRSVADRATAEQVLTSEAAAEALADTAGYSDRLLLDVLGAETDDAYLVVAHRDGDDIEYVAGDADDLDGDVSLQSIHATFPIDKSGLDSIFANTDELALTVTLGEHIVYRFVAGDNRETNIVLLAGTQVVSPGFERTIWNVLEEKWGSDHGS